jgi:hypothetical protein
MPPAKKVRLAVDIDEDVRDALRIAVAENREEIRDFVNRVLRQACAEQFERLRPRRLPPHEER